MSDKESKKEDSIKLKKPTQISLEMGLINEQATKNSSEITSYGFDGGYKVNNFSLSINGDNTLESENFKIKVDYQDDAVFMKDFTLDDMREQFGEGKSVSDIVSKMRDFIIDSKETNPDNIQREVSALLGSVEELYDHCIHEYGLNVLAKQEGYH